MLTRAQKYSNVVLELSRLVFEADSLLSAVESAGVEIEGLEEMDDYDILADFQENFEELEYRCKSLWDSLYEYKKD